MFTLIWKENGVVRAEYRKNFKFSGNKSTNKKQYKPLLKDPLLKVEHIM